MIGLALALIVIGIVFLFVFPWVGVPLGIVGVILLVLYLAGFVRRTAEPGP
jgi:hypothetical protein